MGEEIRKTRKDRYSQIKELASYLGVTEDTVINREKRGVKPMGKIVARLKSFLET